MSLADSTRVPNQPIGRSSRTARACTWVAVGCLFLANSWRTEADADLWGHLRFGLDALASGRLAETDPYSYTAAGAAWTNHEWLSELVFAACYRVGGAHGLIVLRGTLLALTFAAVGIIIRRRGLSSAATLGLALFGITFLPEFYRVRPQMFTYTAFSWLIVACDGYTTNRRWPVVVLPLLFGLWCNFHAGFVAGLGIFGIYWVSFVWQAWRRRNCLSEIRCLGLVLAGCVAATLCNPYGIEYWQYVLSAISMSRPAITEWGPVWTHHPVVVGCYLAAVLVPFACWLGSTRRGTIAETAAFVLVAYLSARHARHIPFTMILGAVVFCRRWPEFRVAGADGREGFLPAQQPTALARLGFALLALAAILGGATKLAREVAAAQTEGALTVAAGLYPVAAVAFLDDQKISGNLYCGFSWGEYCLWHLAPRCPVFCDGRYETVYRPEISALALSGLPAQAERCAVVEQYPTEILLVPADDAFAAWLSQRGDFAEIYCDRLARIFLKRTGKFADAIGAFSGPSRASGSAAPQVPFPG